MDTDCYINDKTTVDWGKDVVTTLEGLPDVTMLPTPLFLVITNKTI